MLYHFSTFIHFSALLIKSEKVLGLHQLGGSDPELVIGFLLSLKLN